MLVILSKGQNYGQTLEVLVRKLKKLCKQIANKFQKLHANWLIKKRLCTPTQQHVCLCDWLRQYCQCRTTRISQVAVTSVSGAEVQVTGMRIRRIPDCQRRVRDYAYSCMYIRLADVPFVSSRVLWSITFFTFVLIRQPTVTSDIKPNSQGKPTTMNIKL